MVPYSWLRFACSGSLCAVWGNSCRACQRNHPIIMNWVFNPSTFSVCSFSVQRVEFLQLDFVRLWSAGCIQASLHGSTLMSECLVGKTLWSLFLFAVSVWTQGDINEKMHSNEPCNYKLLMLRSWSVDQALWKRFSLLFFWGFFVH
jgi:hypothetical protein